MSTIIRFPGATPDHETEFVELAKIVVCAGVYRDQFARIAGADSFSDLVSSAARGGLATSGVVDIRRYNDTDQSVLEKWGYEFRQVDPDETAYNFRFELGNETGSFAFSLSISSEGRRTVKNMICHRCKQSSMDWKVCCVTGRGWGCSESCCGLLASFRCGSAYFRKKSVSVGPPTFRGKSVTVTRIGKTSFFKDRNDLFANIPGIFNVHVEGRPEAIGYFIAHPRQMPVVESKRVRLFMGGAI